MGQELGCTVRFGRNASEGTARLEPDQLLFCGDFRLSIPLAHVTAAEAKRGQLRVTFPEGTATFDLGPAAETWALKIRYPKSLIDKLGVKPESRVAVLGVTDQEFWKQLKARATDIAKGTPLKESDLLFFLAEAKADLTQLTLLQAFLKKTGAIWVVAPKGKQSIKESDVIAAGKEAGLVDTKVVSFSETHTGHKLVIPVARR